MPSTYTIYLQNQSADVQTFWCFVTPPQQLENDPDVFAISDASVAVLPNYAGINKFVIPMQCVVGAGASNQPVGRDSETISGIANKASPTDTWTVNYANAPPKEGPTMTLAGTRQSPTEIAIVTNDFDKESNEQAGWFANQSFGIGTEAGFIGMTWSPEPSMTRMMTVPTAFYVSIRSYGSNQGVSWEQVSSSAAVVVVPTSFDEWNHCTVTLTPASEWLVTPGAPATFQI